MSRRPRTTVKVVVGVLFALTILFGLAVGALWQFGYGDPYTVWTKDDDGRFGRYQARVKRAVWLPGPSYLAFSRHSEKEPWLLPLRSTGLWEADSPPCHTKRQARDLTLGLGVPWNIWDFEVTEDGENFVARFVNNRPEVVWVRRGTNHYSTGRSYIYGSSHGD